MNAKMKQVYEKMVKKRGLRRTGLKIYYNYAQCLLLRKTVLFFLHSQCFPKMKSGQAKIGLDGKKNLLFPSGADLKCFFILTASQHSVVNIQAKNECYC